jgi:hypothetical protein
MEVLVFENVGHVLAHAGEAEEFVLDAFDLDGGDGGALGATRRLRGLGSQGRGITSKSVL